jgi:hypothetical protein
MLDFDLLGFIDFSFPDFVVFFESVDPDQWDGNHVIGSFPKARWAYFDWVFMKAHII